MEKNLIAQTEHLLLRRYTKDDLTDLFEYLSDKQVVKYEPYKPMNMDEAAKELDYRISTDEMLAVELKSNGKMIGNIYLGKRDYRAIEIGYVFHKQYQGQGYATEGCRVLIQKAFSENVHRIYAECDPCNFASWHLLERLGFQREAHHRQNVYFWKDENGNPIWKDTYVYALLNPQA